MFTLLIVAVVLILFRNLSFVLIYSPFVKIFFYIKKKARKEDDMIEDDMQILNQGFSFKKCIKGVVSGFAAYYLFRLSYTPSHHVRNFVYRHVCGMNLCSDAVIYYGTEIREPSKITIGRGSIIGDHSILDGRNGIVIKENVVFASDVKIWTEQHDHRDAYFRCKTQKHGPVIIDDRAWIGSHTVILHSVHIGEGAVVAAGSVVTHDVLPFTIVAGIPAKKIGERNRNLLYSFNGEHRHFI